MRHYVLPADYDGSGSLELSREETRYLTRVLRMRPGEKFIGVDSHGNPVSIWLKATEPGRSVLEITHDTSHSRPASSQKTGAAITLFQCIPKAGKMDLIVRQAVEAGVERIVPVLSEYAVPRIDADGSKKKRERWLRIARQAMQQSGRKTIPHIASPLEISKLPGFWGEISGSSDVCLLFHEKPVETMSLHRLLLSGPSAVGICIGPEGGFSESEAESLLHSGLQPVYINTNVLRTETAALYAVAAVQTVILEKDSWKIRR
jgi:16S rRNA (uracil1498-N3)-methyltransferase